MSQVKRRVAREVFVYPSAVVEPSLWTRRACRARLLPEHTRVRVQGRRRPRPWLAVEERPADACGKARILRIDQWKADVFLLGCRAATPKVEGPRQFPPRGRIRALVEESPQKGLISRTEVARPQEPRLVLQICHQPSKSSCTRREDHHSRVKASAGAVIDESQRAAIEAFVGSPTRGTKFGGGAQVKDRLERLSRSLPHEPRPNVVRKRSASARRRLRPEGHITVKQHYALELELVEDEKLG